MTPKRAAVYIGGFALLAAWLASAASTSLRREAPRAAVPASVERSTDALVAQIQAHAERLRHRLAAAPAPQRPLRNPFAFGVRELPRAAPAPAPEPSPVEALPPPLPFAPAEPLLVLIGIAEDQGPNGPVRTALVADEGEELHMIKVGDSLAGRYRVAAIGADALELTDVSSGGVRRLALRP